MAKFDKERFEGLVKTGGWSINTLADFIGISPKELIAGDDIEYRKFEMLAHLLGVSVSFLNGEGEDTGAPKINPDTFGTFRASEHVKDVDKQYYKYIAWDLGMSLAIFYEIMNGVIGMPISISSRFHNVTGKYRTVSKSCDYQPQSIPAIGYPQVPIPVQMYHPLPNMKPEDQQLVKEIMGKVARISGRNALTTVIRYCKAYRNVRAIEFEINK